MTPNLDPNTAADVSLKGREVVVCVCGGIAVYKVADAVSKLTQLGAGVTVCMTDEAQRFVAPLTFQTLTARQVHTDTFTAADPADTQHIALTERAQLLVVAPATANILAKAAVGLTDDLVSLLICASACPILFCPAMNNRMWENPVTRENVAKLRKIGHRFLGPEEGHLACKNVGPGRLAEPSAIVETIVQLIGNRT